MNPNIINLDNYIVSHYNTNLLRVVVVFTSAGQQGAGEPIEEFRGTLSKLDVSCVFITDKNNKWFNHPDIEDLYNIISSICDKYENVFVTGESMGGSSAIAFSGRYGKTSRTLSFAPQFSIAPPFIMFDSRYRDIGSSIEFFQIRSFLDWGLAKNCEIIYGNTEWRDAVHAASFVAGGSSISIVDGGGHSVAFFLKILPNNILHKIFSRFTNLDLPFDTGVISFYLGKYRTKNIEYNGTSLQAHIDWDREAEAFFRDGKVPALVPPMSKANLISVGKKTRQSSVSSWSKGGIEEDSQRAVSQSPNGNYSFHTEQEQMPWWEIDLEGFYRIEEVQIYNRSDTFHSAQRASHLRILVANFEGELKVAYEKLDGNVFGCFSQGPLIWRPETKILTNIIRIQILSINPMHFDAIRIFGFKLEDLLYPNEKITV